MSNPQAHPEESVLLRYFDGELAPRKARQVARHLEACWQCRTLLDEMQQSVADCMHYRKNVLEAQLLPAPGPWGDLTGGFARIDAELASESLGERLKRWVTPLARPWAVSAALALGLAAGIFYQLRETPSVEAAALLKRAVAVAESRPAARRPIRVRTRTRQFTVAAGSAAADVRAIFAGSNYNAAEPLSARSYQEWREGLARKSDEVETQASVYRIRTVAEEGVLESAALTLRATDLHPIDGRFEFRNKEWVEFSEVPEASTRDDGLSVETNVGAPMRRAVPSRPDSAPTAGSASISTELQVIAALHGIGADLGDPLEISRADGRVVVAGTGIPDARQREIRRALEGVAPVTVRFAEAPEAPAVAAAEVPAASVRPGVLQFRFEQQLGGRAEFARFSARVLDWNESAMSRAYALRTLAQRFPQTEAMGPEDRETLRDLARAHLEVLTANVIDIQRTLAPVLVSLGGTTVQGRPVTQAGAWQDSAAAVLESARRMDRLLTAVLGATPESGNSGRLPTDLMAAISELRGALEQSARLAGGRP